MPHLMMRAAIIESFLGTGAVNSRAFELLHAMSFTCQRPPDHRAGVLTECALCNHRAPQAMPMMIELQPYLGLRLSYDRGRPRAIMATPEP